MSNSNNNQINRLLEKLQLLIDKQAAFSNEITSLKEEIDRLKKRQDKDDSVKYSTIVEPITDEQPKTLTDKLDKEITKEETTAAQTITKPLPSFKPKKSGNLEKFIGENLINKIGIIITVIGVGIGTKYAINHQLINPLTRIILGYLLGVGLLGFAFKLKEKYTNYSAVLLSGGMAILYFITFSAYSFYELIPQTFAFALMVVFTVFTVIAALNYDKQIIALLGLVGAYAVPFLLSDDSGNVAFLFSYMLTINIGILFIAFKKYWKQLYYAAFVFTWLIFLQWYNTQFDNEQQFSFALIFLTLFFIIFYLTFLSYKLLQKELFNKTDILLLLTNSFLFFGLGYAILSNNEISENYLGLFAVINAIIHFTVSLVIFKQKLGDKNLFYFVTGLVLVFLTMAIPIQLDGNWVTLLWIGEAALLFWIGRTKNVSFYEKLVYPLLLLAFISIIHDWDSFYQSTHTYNQRPKLTPIWNVQFLSSVLFIIALAFINYVRIKSPLTLDKQTKLYKLLDYLIPVLFVFVLYFSIRMEISNYWNQRYIDSAVTQNNIDDYFATKNYDLRKFKSIWVLNYSLLFFAIFSIIGSKFFKTKITRITNLILNLFTLIVFLVQGLYLISELRESYLTQSLSEYYKIGSYHLWIRYISYVFVALLLYTTHQFVIKKMDNNTLKKAFNILIFGSVLWLASSELIHWMDIAESEQSYKFGLSILWGSYALLGIALGIWKNRKYLRISAIVLFAVTLAKLFLYDITELNSLAKTIAFVSLGILLLIISFLYNKYKQLIFDETED